MASLTSLQTIPNCSSAATFPTHTQKQILDGKSTVVLITPAIKKSYPDDIIKPKATSTCMQSIVFGDGAEADNNILLRCLECPETFHDSTTFHKHFLDIHRKPLNGENQSGEVTLLRCLNCNEKFPCSITLKVHNQEHVLPNVQQFSSCPSLTNNNNNNRLLSISYACQICDMSFVTRELLVEHSNIHLQGHKCNNQTCQLLYGNLIPNRTSNQIVSNNKMVVVKTINSPAKLIIEPENQTFIKIESNSNSSNKKSEILPSNNTNNNNNNIKISFVSNNNNEPCKSTQCRRKRFQCQYCHKILSSKLSHEEHSRIHTQEKPYLCTVCLKMFAVKNTFRQHMAAHRGGGRVSNYKCSVCSESFLSSEKLDYHSCRGKSSSSTKRGESFRCKICWKIFGSKNKECRTKHYLSHAGESCFHCETCGDIFPDSKKNDYLIHAQNHFSSEIKKTFLNCKICGKRFPSRDLYERHSCRFAGVNSSG